MKKLFFFLCFIAAVGCTNAQTQTQAPAPFTPPAYIPAYKILTTDSVNITPANLKKNKPIMIVYFAPDCSHCQHLMYELKPHMKELKNIQVVMITFTPQIKAIQTFYRDFDLKKWPNWTIGTEGYTYNVQQFYHVATTPYIAIYDKNAKPVKYIDKDPKVADILAATKKL